MDRDSEVAWLLAALERQADKFGVVAVDGDGNVDWATSRKIWAIQNATTTDLNNRLEELSAP